MGVGWQRRGGDHDDWRDPIGEARHPHARGTEGALGVVADSTCPACGGPGRVWRTAPQVSSDLALLREHWRSSRPGRGELKLLNGGGAALATCLRCASSWRRDRTLRAEVTARYAADRYPPTVLGRAFADGVHAWRAAEPWFRSSGVTWGAHLLEVGSYDGSFLAYASSRGCRAVGVDVGGDAVAFARARGCAVVHGGVEAAEPLAPFDVVAVLTCLDQVADPRALLTSIARLLAPGGHLVVRTPNAEILHEAAALGGWAQVVALRHLLWGQPYLQCFTTRGLEHLLESSGFRSLRWRGAGSAPGHDLGRGRRRAAVAPWLHVSARPSG